MKSLNFKSKKLRQAFFERYLGKPVLVKIKSGESYQGILEKIEDCQIGISPVPIIWIPMYQVCGIEVLTDLNDEQKSKA